MQRNKKVWLMYSKTKTVNGRYVDTGLNKDKSASINMLKELKEIISPDL